MDIQRASSIARVTRGDEKVPGAPGADKIEILVPGEHGERESILIALDVGFAPSPQYVESLARAIAQHVASNSPPVLAPPRRVAGLAPHRLHRVLAYIDEHVDEPVCVRQLADAVHMSPFHFARMFKEAVGHPPHGYITRVRMDRAKKLLTDTELALVEVAASVGYQTQAHFTGVFHHYVGTTPRAFRLRSQAHRYGA